MSQYIYPADYPDPAEPVICTRALDDLTECILVNDLDPPDTDDIDGYDTPDDGARW